MGFKYTIDKQLKLLFIHFSETLDNAEFLKAFTTAYADPAFTPGMNQCVNYSAVTNPTFNKAGIERLSTLNEGLNARWETYIIAPDDLLFGYGRMYQLISDNANEDVHVVRTLKAALELMSLVQEQYPFLNAATAQPV